jgi:DNA-binding response OmpR family regulator
MRDNSTTAGERAIRRVLVVDDDDLVRAFEEKLLTREGFDVVTAADGAAALELIDGRQLDLVLLDIAMPGVDGFEVARALRRDERYRHTPVILVSGRDDAATSRAGFAAGGSLYLHKPFDARQLGRLVRTMIGD